MSVKDRTCLGALSKGTQAKIVQVGRPTDSLEFTARLMEMGFLEGSLVEVVHEAPFGQDPIAVRVRGAMIALRRNEANAIEVVAV